MNDFDSSLYPLFNYLRRSAVPIGVGDYLLAVETLRAGKGISSLAEIQFVCKLLWAKSIEDQSLLDQAFKIYLAPQFGRASDSKADPASNRPSPDRSVPDESSSDQPLDPPSEKEPDISDRLARDLLPLNPDNTPSNTKEGPKSEGPYILTPQLPISKREMASIWRHLRLMKHSGPKTELDIDKTIASICETGFLTESVYSAVRKNQSKLLILLDCQGSMLPFLPLTDALLQSIQGSGLLGQSTVRYFHNCPEGYLAKSAGLVDFKSIETAMTEHNDSVLIISDGGAARGTYRSARVEQTKEFLNTINQYSHLVAWLNPLPRKRWRGTTADHIAEFIPMYPIDRDGLVDSVNALRGRGTQARQLRYA